MRKQEQQGEEVGTELADDGGRGVFLVCFLCGIYGFGVCLHEWCPIVGRKERCLFGALPMFWAGMSVRWERIVSPLRFSVILFM